MNGGWARGRSWKRVRSEWLCVAEEWMCLPEMWCVHISLRGPRVRKLLNKWGLPNWVCQTGLFHQLCQLRGVGGHVLWAHGWAPHPWGRAVLVPGPT